MDSEPLKRYMASGQPADLPGREYLKEVAWRYPWFRLPAYLLAEYDRLGADIQPLDAPQAPALETAVQVVQDTQDRQTIPAGNAPATATQTQEAETAQSASPEPVQATETAMAGETEEATAAQPATEDKMAADATAQAASPGEDRIEAFLRTGPHRIIANDDTPEQIDGIETSGYDNDDLEFATEELAEIYLEQGLKSMALDIYGKLCLVYPEKSVYFAELIAEIKGDNN